MDGSLKVLAEIHVTREMIANLGHTIDLDHPTVVHSTALSHGGRRWPNSRALKPGWVGKRRARSL